MTVTHSADATIVEIEQRVVPIPAPRRSADGSPPVSRKNFGFDLIFRLMLINTARVALLYPMIAQSFLFNAVFFLWAGVDEVPWRPRATASIW